MAFATKTDYCGLATVFDELSIRDDNKNDSKQTYLPVGQDGSIIAVEVYGDDASPSNAYALTANISATANELCLGKIVTSGTEKFALKSVSISTGANSPVSVSASSELVQSSATDDNTKMYGVPAFSLSTNAVAQDIFSSFTITGDGANLVSCNTEISADIQKDTLVGSIITYGTGNAKIVVSGSILMSGSGAPTVTATASSGFVVTKPPVCSNPESAYRTYTFELTKPLTKGVPVS